MVNEVNTKNVEEKNEKVVKAVEDDIDEKILVTIGFKSGNTIKIKCDHYTFKHIENDLTGYKFEGIEGEIPIYIDISQIEYVLQS